MSVVPLATTAAAPALGTGQYVIYKDACPAPAPGEFGCLAKVRVPVPAGTPGATRLPAPAYKAGPAGGYTPAVLATAYGYNRLATPRAGTLVGIVMWGHHPRIRADLNHFDAHYGLPRETTTSFRVVNQAGTTTSFAANNPSAAIETVLDVQSVRAVCAKCRILLVEARTASEADLAAAENTAARLGSTVITNSWGAPEHLTRPASAAFQRAFKHNGVVITAATGDSGWYGWDYANVGEVSDGTPSYPASLPSVVAVGATTLTVDRYGRRTAETVWNDHGPLDATAPGGATGGGCSRWYAATTAQRHAAGYAAAGCAGKRLATDVSVDGDPDTGLDIYSSYGDTIGWATVGGTSLASPILGAMWALAGGSGKVAVPTVNMYDHLRYTPTRILDIRSGGSGFCGGANSADCAEVVDGRNPNTLGYGEIDCSFPKSGQPTTPPALSRECNATTGFDGASGVGTPKGLRMFRSMMPAPHLADPGTVRRNKLTWFHATATLFIPNTHIVTWTWKWGDGMGRRTRTGNAPHIYARSGTYKVTLTVTDNIGRHGTTTRVVRVRA